MKHSKGTWEFEYQDGDKSSEIVARDDYRLNEPVCIIPHDDITEEGEECMLANARLIEAVPAMVNALLQIRDSDQAPSWCRDMAREVLENATTG